MVRLIMFHYIKTLAGKHNIRKSCLVEEESLESMSYLLSLIRRKTQVKVRSPFSQHIVTERLKISKVKLMTQINDSVELRCIKIFGKTRITYKISLIPLTI